MNVGDYVRVNTKTYNKFVGITKLENETNDYWFFKDLTIVKRPDKRSKKTTNINELIIKSSPNIIDLLEVGDILSFEDGSICRIMEITDNGYYLLKDYGGDQYYERQEYLSDLKSIVTKEQFSQMEYKVGE